MDYFYIQLYCNFIGVDLIGPLKEYDGKEYIATAVCYFTKFVEARAISNKMAEEVGTFIYELFFGKILSFLLENWKFIFQK